MSDDVNLFTRMIPALMTTEERSQGDASVMPKVEAVPTVSRPINGGAQHIFAFDNGWAASVVQHDYSYGHEDGLWEIAVGRYDAAAEHFALDYTTHITDDVLGGQSDEDVAAVLIQVASLGAAS